VMCQQRCLQINALYSTAVSDPIRGLLGSPRNPPISNNIYIYIYIYIYIGFPTLSSPFKGGWV
jgi:hypothetical protein